MFEGEKALGTNMVENITFRKGINPLKKKTLQRIRFTGESPNTKLKQLRNCGVDLNGD